MGPWLWGHVRDNTVPATVLCCLKTGADHLFCRSSKATGCHQVPLISLYGLEGGGGGGMEGKWDGKSRVEPNMVVLTHSLRSYGTKVFLFYSMKPRLRLSWTCDTSSMPSLRQSWGSAQHVSWVHSREAVVGATALEDLSWAQALPSLSQSPLQPTSLPAARSEETRDSDNRQATKS